MTSRKDSVHDPSEGLALSLGDFVSSCVYAGVDHPEPPFEDAGKAIAGSGPLSTTSSPLSVFEDRCSFVESLGFEPSELEPWDFASLDVVSDFGFLRRLTMFLM